MEQVLLVSRAILAAALLGGAVAKVMDCPETYQSGLTLGVPRRVASLLAGTLPLIEGGIGASLLWPSYAWQAAIAAVFLFAFFTTIIAVNLSRGRTPACRCFGHLSSRPLGIVALLRAELLTAVAGLIVWQGNTKASADIYTWFVTLGIEGRVLFLVAVPATVLAPEWLPTLLRSLPALSQQSNRNGGIARSPLVRPVDGFFASGLPVRAAAPRFNLESLVGGQISLDDLLLTGKPILLLFSDPSHVSSTALATMIGRWRSELSTYIVIVVIGIDNGAAERVAEAYHVRAVPSGVVLQPDGRIGSCVATGMQSLDALVKTLRTSSGCGCAGQKAEATNFRHGGSYEERIAMGADT